MKRTFTHNGIKYNVLLVDGITNAIFETGKIEMVFETSLNLEHKKMLYVYITDEEELWCVSFYNNVEECCNRVA